jgi:hypothetical protein
MATTTTTTLPTGWADQAAYGNFQQALQASQRPYAQYPGQQLADWNTGQLGAYQAVMGPGGATGADTMGLGRNAAAAAAQYNPMMVNQGGYQPWMQGFQDTVAMSAGPAANALAAQMGRGEIQDVQAQSFPGANLQQYLNPFTSSVIDTTMQQLGRQNDILGNQTRARAAAAGAFGGTRETLAQSENNRAFLDTAGRTISGLNQANFGQAQQAIATDQNRALQAAGMNQAQDWNVGSANLGNRQATGLQNMLASNQMSQYNAGLAQTASGQSAAARNAALTAQAQAGNEAGRFNSNQAMEAQLANQTAGQNAANTRLSAANALNGMGLDQQKQLLTAADAQMKFGSLRQAQDQAMLTQQQQNWQQQRDYPMEQLKILQSGLTGVPFGRSETSPYYNNTLAQVGQGLMGGAQLLANGGDIVSGAKDLYGGLSSGWNALKGWF